LEHNAFLNLVKQQVIIAILADDELGEHLVLKGGNLLQFAYELTSRASKDIDVSMDGDGPDSKWLSERVLLRLQHTFATENLVVFDFNFREVPAEITDDIRSFWGGYQCDFKLVSKSVHDANAGDEVAIRKRAHTLSGTGGTKFKIDFSRHEFCEDTQEFEIGGYTVSGYSPRMFVAEKLRAICQQMPEYGDIVHRSRPSTSRARDFVDIYVIANLYGVEVGKPEFQQTLINTFAAKKVPLDYLGRVKDSHGHHKPDFASVEATVQAGYALRDFEFYFSFVCGMCKELEPLWDK
jgi:hypothetical protein